MKNALKRLRLKEGDIIVVRHPRDVESLMKIKDPKLPNCPIIIAQGSIHRLSKEYWKKLVANA